MRGHALRGAQGGAVRDHALRGAQQALWSARVRSQTRALAVSGFKNWCCQSEVWTPGSKGDMDRAAMRTGTSISLFLRAFRSEGEALPHRGHETALPALKQRRAAASRERHSRGEEGRG